MAHAMKREFLEETGLEIEIEENIGVSDFKLPWIWREYTDVHHVAAYYSVRKIGGKLRIPQQFEGQDSLAALFVSESDVCPENASPLVFKAFEWLQKNKLGIEAEILEDCKVIK